MQHRTSIALDRHLRSPPSHPGMFQSVDVASVAPGILQSPSRVGPVQYVDGALVTLCIFSMSRSRVSPVQCVDVAPVEPGILQSPSRFSPVQCVDVTPVEPRHPPVSLSCWPGSVRRWRLSRARRPPPSLAEVVPVQYVDGVSVGARRPPASLAEVGPWSPAA